GSGDAIAGGQALADAGISPGVIKPFVILVRGGDPRAVAATVRRVPRVVGAVAPTDWRRGDLALVEAFPANDGSAKPTQKTIGRVNATGSIMSWIPLMVFACLFGLSMDYEVFMLTRMREAYDETGNTRQAVSLGLARTGKLVTSAALVLMFAFFVLSTSPGVD